MVERNKVKLNGSISEWIDTRVRELSQEGTFSSPSNFYENSAMYLLSALDKNWELQAKKAEDELEKTTERLQRECELRIQRVQTELDVITNELKNSKDLIYKLIIKHPELAQEIRDLDCKPQKKPIEFE